MSVYPISRWARVPLVVLAFLPIGMMLSSALKLQQQSRAAEAKVKVESINDQGRQFTARELKLMAEDYQRLEARMVTLEKYDLDHDGRLDDAELRTSLIDLNSRSAAATPQALKESGGGVRGRVVLPSSGEDVAKFDLDRDGRLNDAEWKVRTAAFMEKYDTNQDGKIDDVERKKLPRRRVVLPL
jgi:hypothetical protein